MVSAALSLLTLFPGLTRSRRGAPLRRVPAAGPQVTRTARCSSGRGRRVPARHGTASPLRRRPIPASERNCAPCSQACAGSWPAAAGPPMVSDGAARPITRRAADHSYLGGERRRAAGACSRECRRGLDGPLFFERAGHMRRDSSASDSKPGWQAFPDPNDPGSAEGRPCLHAGFAGRPAGRGRRGVEGGGSRRRRIGVLRRRAARRGLSRRKEGKGGTYSEDDSDKD
jgi:hypothetical protein